MELNIQLAQRFREVILNGKWIANTNFKDQLSSINWLIATRSFETLNSIATLARHVHYYINGINKVFQGGSLDIRDQFSFDFSPIESQTQWEDFLMKFWKDSEEFAKHVESMTEVNLLEDFTDPKYGSYARNIDGMIEHSYYHLGQIVLIRKLLIGNSQ